jgi:FkbM family methyltransferase
VSDIIDIINNTYPSDYNGTKNKSWCTDQDILTEKAQSYEHFHILNKSIKRLEVNKYKQHLKQRDVNFTNNYDDVHFHRNFHTNKQLIEHMYNMVICKQIFYSQQGEDLFIYRNFINKPMSGGIFVELGGYDGITYSNTKFFEDSLGFTGLLIEPTINYNKMILNRPKCINVNMAITDEEKEVEFIGTGADAGISEHMGDYMKEACHKKSSKYMVKGMPFKTILQNADIKYIDLLTIDVEGGEQQVLETMDWNIPTYVICIELDGHKEEKDESCRTIMKENGFVLYERMCINEFWVNNAYFRKELLWNNENVFNFKSINELGRHVFMERHVIPEIETSLTKHSYPTFVSGYEFYKLAKWSIDNRYVNNLNMKKIQNNDLVFINTDLLMQVLPVIKANLPEGIKFRLITHNSDRSMTDAIVKELIGCCSKIYSINNTSISDIAVTLPIGFVDNTSKNNSMFRTILKENNVKNCLLYMNFAINTNKQERQFCFNHFNSEQYKDFIKIESNLQPINFYRSISTSKYILSPIGHGIDCHRVYESIYFDSIAILKRTGTTMDKFYETLPVLLVTNWNEITKELLESRYDELYNNIILWKKEHNNWMKASSWIQ